MSQVRTTTFRGRDGVPLREVADALSIPYSRVFARCANGRYTGDDLESGSVPRNQARTTAFRGKQVSLKEVASTLGITYMRVFARCAMGKETGDDLERDSGPRVPYGKLIEINGEKKTFAEWYRLNGINRDTARTRVRRLGWPVERALTEPVRRKQKRDA